MFRPLSWDNRIFYTIEIYSFQLRIVGICNQISISLADTLQCTIYGKMLCQQWERLLVIALTSTHGHTYKFENVLWPCLAALYTHYSNFSPKIMGTKEMQKNSKNIYNKTGMITKKKNKRFWNDNDRNEANKPFKAKAIFARKRQRQKHCWAMKVEENPRFIL